MQSPTLQMRNTSQTQWHRPICGADDFRRLGLGLSEARVSVIRRAAKKMTADLAGQVDTPQHGKAERELALVLTSVYRLLDPRHATNLPNECSCSDPSQLRSVQPSGGMARKSMTPPTRPRNRWKQNATTIGCWPSSLTCGPISPFINRRQEPVIYG